MIPSARQQFPQHDDGDDDQAAQRGRRHRVSPHADLRMWRQMRSRRLPKVSPLSISKVRGRGSATSSRSTMRARTRRHHDDFVGEIDRFGQAMGDEHDGLAGCRPDPQQFVAHGHARLLIERCERLVHQQHRRVLHQPARDRDPLLHAAGQFMRMPLAETLEADQLQRLLRLGAALASWRRRAASAGIRHSPPPSARETGWAPGTPRRRGSGREHRSARR